MVITATTPASRVIKQVAPYKVLDLQANTVLRVIGTSNTPPVNTTLLDRNIISTANSTTVTDYQMVVSSSGGTLNATNSGVYTSSNTNIATVAHDGKVSHVGNGSVDITFAHNNSSKTTTLTLSTNNNSTASTFQSYITGSLAKHISDTVDTRISGKTATNNLKLYTTQDHSTPAFTRNPLVWCSDLPALVTCISPSNSISGSVQAGTLISPRHIIFAAHWELSVGTIMRFVKADGTVVSRTLTAKLTHPDYTPHYPDIAVGVLDSDVDNDISFARILPQNWQDYLPTINGYSDGKLPVIRLDWEEKALIADWSVQDTHTILTIPTDAQRLKMYEPAIGGDSGNPILTVINNTPVILAVLTSGGYGAGTSICYHKTAINTMMTTLGGGYQLTEIDLSGFPTYT